MIRHSFTWKLIYDSRYKSKITSLSIFGQWGFVLAITEKTWRKSKKKSNCKIQDLLHIENNERPHNEMYFWTSGMLSLFLFLSTGALSVFGQHNSVPQIEPRGVVEGFRRNQNQTKPNQRPSNWTRGGSRRRLPSEPKPNLHPTHQPQGLYFHESFQNILSEEKYFSIGRIVGAVTAQSLASIGDLHKSHFLLLETQYTRTSTNKKLKKKECQISKQFPLRFTKTLKITSDFCISLHWYYRSDPEWLM